MLQAEVPGCRFLDLFAGSGGIGIEALSRGARSAVFVENNRQAAACIRENLAFTKLAERAELYAMDVSAALARLSGKEPFDLVFMDPPYQEGLELDTLRQLRTAGLLHEDSLVIVEADLKTSFAYLEELGYQIVKRKEYKTNCHMFLRLV